MQYVAQNECVKGHNRQTTVEGALHMHPGVSESAVVRNGRKGLTAFIVPDDHYMDDVLGRKSAGTAVLNKWRKIYDLSQFTKAAESAPVGFNTVTWDSSYTRKPIPSSDMQEWVQTTVGSILQLQPKIIYEIGCGTGLLLTRIAPQCDRYVAADLSPAVLNNLKNQLRAVPSIANRVELMERTADDFDGLDHNSFDTVVINSVAQYFPNVTYLTRVLENAVKIVKPNGHVFVGDIRSLPLLSAFASSVELFRAEDEVNLAELRDRITRREQRESELVLSPAYFLSLPSRFPKISRVEIWPRCGRADSEMSRYRYNAILHVGQEDKASADVSFHDWTEQEFTLAKIRSMLQQRCEPLGIRRIGNARIAKDIRVLEALEMVDAARTARQLKREVEQFGTSGLHPQDIIDLGAGDLGFQVQLSWAACHTDGSYDAVFVPTRSVGQRVPLAFRWPEPELSSPMHFANAPGQSKFRADLIKRILLHCEENLPRPLVPEEIVLVDWIPRIRTAN